MVHDKWSLQRGQGLNPQSPGCEFVDIFIVDILIFDIFVCLNICNVIVLFNIYLSSFGDLTG